MKITVINGTALRGVTYKLKEIFLDNFRDKAEITEFYLPKDCPAFCAGCKTCFLRDENMCKDREYIAAIEKAVLEADLLVFASPSYVFHVTGAMKAMLDHFGYRWMPHRPAKEMFFKRAIIITQCLGAGEKSAAKDIKDSLSWWGVSSVKTIGFKLMSEVVWEKIPERKRRTMTDKLNSVAKKTLIALPRKPRVKFAVKCKFFIVRAMQTGLGKKDPDYTDYKYWKSNGWIDKTRPWKK